MFFVLVLACTASPGPAADTGPAPTPPGQWYGTDLHLHTSTGSNDTDGVSFVADHAAAARERGLALLVFTDHSNSAGSMDCKTGDVEDCPNQGPEFPARDHLAASEGDDLALAVGLEISPVESLETTTVPTGHVGCLPLPGDPFADVTEAVVDRPVGTVPGGAGVAWCQDNGGFASINHPYIVGPWTEYDWSSDAYDGLEIYNGSGGFDGWDRDSVTAWMCDLAQGRRVVGIGGSDTHRAATPGPPETLLDAAVGWPTTWVRAESLDRDALLGGIAQGRVVVAWPGSFLDLSIGDQGPGGTVSAGQHTVTLAGSTDSSGTRLQLLHLGADACTADPRWTTGEVPTVAPTVLLDQEAAVGALDQQLEVDLEPGALVARLWPDDGQNEGAVLVNPIWIQP